MSDQGWCPKCQRQNEHECDVCSLPWRWCEKHCCQCNASHDQEQTDE